MYSEEGFNFPILKYTDSGAPSADEETLVELRMQVTKPDSPKAIFLDNVLTLRGLEKMYKTYIEGWNEKYRMIIVFMDSLRFMELLQEDFHLQNLTSSKYQNFCRSKHKEATYCKAWYFIYGNGLLSGRIKDYGSSFWR